MDFPYFFTYTEHTPEEMFENLKNLQPLIHKKYGYKHRYRVSGFYPNRRPSSYLPPSFARRNQFIQIDSSNSSYNDIEAITDYFIEPLRMRAKKAYRERCTYDEWLQDPKSERFEELLPTLSNDEIRSIRDHIYCTTNEPTLFRVSWIKGLYQVLEPYLQTSNFKIRRVLDPSAGWGDRLITTMSMDWEYTGYDPNINLESAHSKMISLFGDPQSHKVIYEPFEKSEPSDLLYDIVFTSPPFFNMEVFDSDPETNNEQSIVQYPTFDMWREKFLISSLVHAWNQLLPGGIMAIHLADFKVTESCNLVEFTLDAVADRRNLFPSALYMGMIGLTSGKGKTWPVLVWSKTPDKWSKSSR